MKFIDMFAGIGGFRTGLESAGHHCVGYIEWDKYARQSYQAIYNTEGEYTENDIQQAQGEQLPEADIWTFGSPCTDISVAGKQAGLEKGKASSMFFEVIRLLKERIKHKKTLPSYLLMENVKNLLSSNGGRDFARVLTEMDAVGYDVEWTVINSAEVVPQNRERIYIVGHRRGVKTTPVFPIKNKENHTFPKLADVLESHVDNKYFLSQDKVEQLLYNRQQNQNNTGLSKKPTGKINKLGHYADKEHQSNIVYGSNGVSPTLTATDYKRPPKVAVKDKTDKLLIKNNTKKGYLEAKAGDGVDLSFPTSNTRRGRVQEKRSNTLETGSHLGVVVPKIHQLGNISNSKSFGGNPQAGRVYDTDGLSPTLNTMQGGDRQPKILVNKEVNKNSEVKATLTPDRLNKRQNGRRFKEDGEPEFTLTAQDRHGVLIEDDVSLAIRKLTPLECWRLQGFSDEQFYKAKNAGVSNSQLYKQAGNAVTTKVIEQIGKKIK